MLDCMTTLVLCGISILLSIVSIVVHQFTFPPAVYEGSLFSTLSSAFVVCRSFNDGHFAHCEVVPHCSFYLHFKHLFICVLAISMLSLEKYLSDLLPIFPIGLFVFVVVVVVAEFYELFVYFGN